MNDLPVNRDVGVNGRWDIPSVGGFDGVFLGWSTSLSHRHTHGGPVVPAGIRCSACRWSEFRIFKSNAGYILHFTGRTTVPGEETRYRHETAIAALEVVEILTTRRRSPVGGQREAFLTVPAGRVLAQASAHDAKLRDAYYNRAVV